MLGLKKRLRAGSWPGYEIAKDSTTRPREINIGDAAWRCVTVSKRNLAKKRSHHTCTVRVRPPSVCSCAPWSSQPLPRQPSARSREHDKIDLEAVVE